MKITTQDIGSRQLLLSIEADEEQVEKALRGAARRVSKQYRIPGFRRGRAPYKIVLRHFGREALLKEALDELSQNVLTEGLKEANITPYAQPVLEDVQLDPLVFQVYVPLLPVVELGDYRELRLEPPPVVVDEAEIDEELERLRQNNAIWEPVEDRPAEMGDVVSLDVEMDVEGETYVDKESHFVSLDPEEDEFAPGFAEQIVGMEIGEEKHFVLPLPPNETTGGEEAEDEAVAGQEASFTVRLHEIGKRILPDLDDDLARTVGDFDTLEELRAGIHRRFEAREQAQADEAYAQEVLDTLVDQATIECPPEMVEDQIDHLIEDLKERIKAQGLSFEDYLKLSGQTEENVRDALVPRAEQSLWRGLVLGKVVQQEKLDVESKEIDKQIQLVSAEWGEHAERVQQALASPEGVQSIANSLLTNKAVQRLIAIAKGEAPPLEAEKEQEVETLAIEAGDLPIEITKVDKAPLEIVDEIPQDPDGTDPKDG